MAHASAQTSDNIAALQEGDAAPPFSGMPLSGGGTANLSDYAGKKLVLYFYPKDDTPGCTKEAIGFTEALGEFAKENTAIVGVSKDSVAKHDKFIAKHNLAIPLISDEDGVICEAYGTWIEKSMYGRKYMGIDRATFLIDASGKITKIWRKVSVTKHVDSVLDAVKSS